MGTNYYRRAVPTADDYKHLVHLVKEAPITEALEFISKQEAEIHIGKSSYGWNFIFNLNGRKFYETREQLDLWLKSGEIVDEYGAVLTFEDFMLVVKNRGLKPQSHLDFGSSFSSYALIDGLEFLDATFS